jgi:hypothetical protein
MRNRDLGMKYETVAASQTEQALGATGRTGDYLERLVIVPETTTAGTVALLDGTVSTNVLVAGTLSNLAPIVIPIGARSTTGAWNITTGTSVHVIAVGIFS